MAQIFRGMTEGPDGLPRLGDSARTLGIRGGIDVLAAWDADRVLPGTGGLSVSPGSPFRLPKHRRPPQFGGEGRDPIWMISEEDLGEALRYRPDPMNPDHGFIEPAREMPLAAYREALAATRSRWRKFEARMSWEGPS